MSKIEELLEKLCPNGVEYIELKEVCTFNRGTPITSKIAKNGNIPVISGGQKPAFYHNMANRPENTITIAGSGAYAGYVSFWKEPIFCSDSFSIDIVNENILNKRYLYYFLLNNQNKIYSKKVGAGIPHVYGKDIANFFIPVPPLEIQSEIVYILDKFTALLAELKAELKARKKQYAYYRDELLAFKNENIKKLCPNGVESMYLKDIGQVRMCKRILKYETNTRSGIPFYKIGTFGKKADAFISEEMFNRYKQQFSYPKKGDILISCSGTIGKIVVFDGEPAYFQDSNIVWLEHDESKVLNEYLKHVYTTRPWRITTGGTISRLYNGNILNTKIPVPPLEIQCKIVRILDKFEQLCNSLTEGIPAEIEARQQQYEYYRDKLLTFKELEK